MGAKAKDKHPIMDEHPPGRQEAMRGINAAMINSA
jgi:hypothetical protein